MRRTGYAAAMMRSPIVLTLGLAASLLACRAPDTTAAQEEAPAAAPAPTPRSLPLALVEMLELVGEHDDYLVLRDAQALLDAGVPWSGLARAQPADAWQSVFLTQLQKWVDGPDPPFQRAGLELRGGLVVTAVEPRHDVFVLASRDPALTATLLTTLPLPHSDRFVCRGLASAPPHAICAMHEPALAQYRAGGGAARRDALAAALPGVDLEAATLLGSFADKDIQFTAEIGVGRQTLHVHVGGDELLRSVDAALAPGPAPLLRFVGPGVGFAWARVDAKALLLRPEVGEVAAPLMGLAQAWTGELLLSGVAAPAGLQLRAGLSETKSATAVLGLLALDATGAAPIAGIAGGQVRRDASTVAIAGETTPLLRTWIEGAPQVAGVAAALGLAPRAAAFAAHGSLALMLGLDDPKDPALAPQADPEAALRELPPAAAADLRAGRTLLLVHAPLDALQSPQMRTALAAVADLVDADVRDALREALRELRVLSSLTLWATEREGRLLWHLSVTSIGHTADPQGRGALAAAFAEPESAPTAFAALAAAHPDAPLAAAYRARAGADGPAALTRSLVGAAMILGAVLVRLADADADDPDAP